MRSQELDCLAGNVHEVAQQIDPGVRVACADNDLIESGCSHLQRPGRLPRTRGLVEGIKKSRALRPGASAGCGQVTRSSLWIFSARLA